MSQAEAYIEFLRTEGYRPEQDETGDIVFKCEGRFYCITVDDDDPLYFRLLFPNFWGLDNEPERHRARIAAAEVSAEFKAVKLYPLHDDMQAAVELFLARPGDFALLLGRCILALQGSVRRFCELMDRGPRLRLVEET